MLVVATIEIVGANNMEVFMDKQKRPTEMELKILSVLWENGPMTVRDVMKSLPDEKKRAYTTILSTMQKMEKKGFLSHESQGNAHIYRPELSQKRTLGSLMKNLVNNVFGGSASSVVQTLLSSESIDKDELEEIKKLLDEK